MYNPSQHIPLSKPMGAGAFPLDGKFMFYTNGVGGVFKYRPFVDVVEVLSYFPTDFRIGSFEILVNTGGTLSGDGGSITGGINSVYWFANGVSDVDLVLKVGNSGNDVIFTNDDVDVDGFINYEVPTGKTIMGVDIAQIIGGDAVRSNLFPSYDATKVYGFTKLDSPDTQTITIKIG